MCEKRILSSIKEKESTPTIEENEIPEEEGLSIIAPPLLYRRVEEIPNLNTIYAFGGVPYIESQVANVSATIPYTLNFEALNAKVQQTFMMFNLTTNTWT